MATKVASKFPQFCGLLDTWRLEGAVDLQESPLICPVTTTLGEPLSLWSQFVHYSLSLLAEDTRFIEAAERIATMWTEHVEDHRRFNAVELIKANPQSWSIPTKAEASSSGAMVLLDSWDTDPSCLIGCSGIVLSFSAASMATRFLNSIHQKIREHIRKIVLLEDYESAANPSSHAQGLIPFCRQNPRLRIERVVNLWSTVILGECAYATFPKNRIVKSVGRWIVEALALPGLGMPEGSFQLTFDGSTCLEKSLEAIEAVREDAASQAALDICYERGSLPCPSWLLRRRRATYQWEALPRALKTIQDGSGLDLIRFNFDIGGSFYMDCLIQERSTWSLQQWERVWEAAQPPNIAEWFRIEAPLPPYKSLRPHTFLCDDYVRAYTDGEIQKYIDGTVAHVHERRGVLSKLARTIARLVGLAGTFQ